MVNGSQEPPGLGTLTERIVRNGLGALHNRGELLVLEYQEERGRLLEMLVWGGAFIFFAIMTFVLLAATVILMVPEGSRVYAAGGFALFFLIGAITTFLLLRARAKHVPFSESIAQIKKDSQWLDSSR
jgi:uncharacterized membrane protein YqjE